MRKLGIATAQFFIYLLFVLATVGVLLSGLLMIAWVFVWRGLAFPVGLREIAFLWGAALVAFALGLTVYAVGSKVLGRSNQVRAGSRTRPAAELSV